MSPSRPAVATRGHGDAPCAKPGSQHKAVAPPSCAATAAAGGAADERSVSQSTSDAASAPAPALLRVPPARCEPTAATTAADAKETASTRLLPGCGGARNDAGAVLGSRNWSERQTATAPSAPPAAKRAPPGPHAAHDV
jgi:hypothetical protein